jgi:hypothetical protein
VNLVGFIVRKFVTIHGHMNVKLVKIYTNDSKDILQHFDVFLKAVNRLLIYIKLLNKTDSKDIVQVFKIFYVIIKTNKCTNMNCIILKHTLKHLKSSYMFRSIDHHQEAHAVPC